MHILYVLENSYKYGAALSAKYMITFLKQHYDVEVTVVIPKKSKIDSIYQEIGCNICKVIYEPCLQAVPYRIWRLPVKYIVNGAMYLIGLFWGIRSLEKQMDINQIDIIHCNSSREDFAAIIAAKYHKKLIWHIREFGDKDFKRFTYRKNYIEFMNKYATEFIAVSEAVQSHWINKGINEDKLVKIYNGVPSDVIYKTDYNRKSNKIKFVMLGGISETKGQWQAIEAVKTLEKNIQEGMCLYLVGDGDNLYINRLKKYVEKNKLKDVVRFWGYQKEFGKHLHEFDCGIMCSKSEGFGRVTVEYMMAGIPVIASDAGANPELVNDGENGLLYCLNDIESLADKLRYVVRNSDLLESMGKKARKVAEKNYSSRSNAEQIYQEYLRIYMTEQIRKKEKE